MKDDYCHDHGGWGSSVKPCTVCGTLRPPNTFPHIPEGLTFTQVLEWGASQMNTQIKNELTK